MEKEIFLKEFYDKGVVFVQNVLDEDDIEILKNELIKAINLENKKYNNKPNFNYGMVLLCCLYDIIFSNIFENKNLMNPFEWVLGENCIVYAYTSSSMPPNGSNFSTRIHVDSPRIIPNYITNMGATICLDDFNEKNGATWFLPNSQDYIDQPNEKIFFENSKRFISKKGGVAFFNARTWHSGGKNLTNEWRHALTINMVRPWMKQRIDIPNAMGELHFNSMTDKTKQKLGYFNQVPNNYDEYYLPKKLRKYKNENE